MNFIDIIGLFGVSAIASAINSVAGGGTFLTFPLLIFYGLSPIQANVTSTIALWPGSVASAVAYRREWEQQKDALPLLMAISVAGSALGAWILLSTPEQTFKSLVPWLLLGATLIFTFGRKAISLGIRSASGMNMPPALRVNATRLMQFTIAVYGGYFGAGIGILMLAMLQLMGLTHIHRMNALKAVLGAAINAVAVVIFIAGNAVVWSVAGVMIAGALAGGYFGAHIAQRCPPEAVRWLVSSIGFSMTIYFFAFA